jgi:hypothetical protein
MPPRPRGPQQPGRERPPAPGRTPGPATGKPVGPIIEPTGATGRPDPATQWPLAFELLELLAALAEFRDLDDEVPLLLLPVRLETKYVMEPPPGELRIRIFPEAIHVDAGADGQPARAALLPQRWVVLGYHYDALLFAEVSEPIAADLVTSLDPGDASWTVAASGIQVSPELAWMFDYERAVDVGMAVTVPLGTGDRLLAEITTLLVVGVDASNDAAAAATELVRMLEGHARDSGFAFVPQGTPTNNTAGVPSGWTREDQEAAARESQPGRPGQPSPPGSNGARFSRLLGLAQPNVSGRVPFATDREPEHARAMNTVLYQALFGTFMGSLLDAGGEGQPKHITRSWRRWLIDHVTGGAPIPTVRVGRQPYGILPVRLLGPADRDTAAGNVETTVQFLRSTWRAAIPAVPTLDPDATDLAGDDADPLDALPAVLASQPHPARIFSRTLWGDGEGLLIFFETVATHRTLIAAMEQNLPLLFDLYEPAVDHHGPFTDIHDQLAFWRGMHDVIDDAEYGIEEPRPSDEMKEEMHDWVDGMINHVSRYVARQVPLELVGLPVYGGVFGEPLTEILGAYFEGTSYEWTPPHLIEDPDAPEAERAASYLPVLATRVTQPEVTSSFAGDAAERAPLLHQLIDGALGHLADHPDDSVAALEALAGLDATQLERMLRESLGLATHRLDAWATSLAAARLDKMRRTRPTGLNIGAYGWVVNLHQGPPSDSEGFVHAPSLAHASTAAVLRSAWQAHGHDAAASPAAVNLDSARVRTADWLVQSLRAGIPLGELLGQQFERNLHDHLLDDQIDDVRRAVIDAEAASGATVRDPVDGVLLLDAWRAGRLETYLVSTGALRTRVEDELKALDALFDALSDATLMEATHHLVQGNLDAASAVLSASSTGTPIQPELTAQRSGRGGTTVDHRLLVVVPAGAAAPPTGAASWGVGLRDRFAAGLERWLREVLPTPDRVGFVTVAADGSERELDLAGIQLSALDVIDLAGPDATVVSPALARVIAAHHGLADDVAIDPSRRGGADLALEELLLLATELRAGLAGATPLGERDLLAAGLPPTGPAPDLAPLAKVLTTTAAELQAALGRNPAAVDVATLARFGHVLQPGDDAGWKRLAGVAQAIVAGEAPGDLDELTRRVAGLFGAAVPVVPLVRAPTAPGDGLVALDPSLVEASRVDDWLDAIGRVRPATSRLLTAAMLSELLGGSPLTWVPGQDRTVAGEGWVAVDRPGTERGVRTSVCAAMPAGSKLTPGSLVSGVVLDRWSERIPRPDRVTGVTFHFDAPNARAPQAWILAVPPEGRTWDLQLIVETLFDVGDWARVRMVQPEDLGGYGHTIPTSFAPSNLRRWPGAEPVVVTGGE